MESLNKEYFKYTGLLCDIIGLFKKCSTKDEKIKLYNTLNWRLKRGLIINSNKHNYTEETKNYASVIAKIAKLAEIDVYDELTDIDKDGDIDSNDKKIFDDVHYANDILSSLDIEIKPEPEPTLPPIQPTLPPSTPEPEPENPEEECPYFHTPLSKDEIDQIFK